MLAYTEEQLMQQEAALGGHLKTMERKQGVAVSAAPTRHVLHHGRGTGSGRAAWPGQ